ncbi:iron-sulfur cluster carrier protein ApbC [Litoribrevibacter euphylliae]|uniref:Iron-sulfur cluster carrier protein n=1 Tax=Litoribrevibacter euphylliae TaxID=1834034 RepID=A0ABV7H892_9GAMM
MIDRSQVEDVISNITDPYLEQNYVEAGAVNSIEIDDQSITVKLTLPYAAEFFGGGVQQLLQSGLSSEFDEHRVEVVVDWKVEAQKTANNLPGLKGVKNIIAVASGKGGVGKSTTSANLALALKHEGARVGLLDADIYGPSQGLMLGVADGVRPEVQDEKFFLPIEAHGLQVMSMAFLVTENTPMVWRGPMVSGALQQLLTQTLWDDLDYLVIDLPPGTGDIQLTLSQKVPVTAAVIVTTPQDLALLDAKKGIEMFRKVNVPVLGVIENMSTHICTKCGHEEPIFGEGGGDRIAKEFGTSLIGELPLSLSIREKADAGSPHVADDPESPIAMMYIDIARRAMARLAQQNQAQEEMPIIQMSDD